MHGASSARFTHQQIRRDIIQKTGWVCLFCHATSTALDGAYEIEFIFGACDADIKETTFFFHLLRFIERTAMRKNAIIETDEKNHAELESLCGMEGEKRRDVALGDGVLIGDERDIL